MLSITSHLGGGWYQFIEGHIYPCNICLFACEHLICFYISTSNLVTWLSRDNTEPITLYDPRREH